MYCTVHVHVHAVYEDCTTDNLLVSYYNTCMCYYTVIMIGNDYDLCI